MALVGGFLLYARQEIFNPDNLAERSKSTLADERTRLAIAQPIVDGIVDSGNGELVNARPLIESVVVSALGTPPAKAAFAEAVRSIGAKLANRSPNTLFLNLTDATVVAAKALDALAPTLGKSVPKELTDVKTAILGSQITITPLHWVHEVDVLGIVLPFLALILLAASIAVAPIRRLAVQRAGVAVGGRRGHRRRHPDRRQVARARPDRRPPVPRRRRRGLGHDPRRACSPGPPRSGFSP